MTHCKWHGNPMNFVAFYSSAYEMLDGKIVEAKWFFHCCASFVTKHNVSRAERWTRRQKWGAERLSEIKWENKERRDGDSEKWWKGVADGSNEWKTKILSATFYELATRIDKIVHYTLYTLNRILVFIVSSKAIFISFHSTCRNFASLRFVAFCVCLLYWRTHHLVTEYWRKKREQLFSFVSLFFGVLYRIDSCE